MFINNKMSIQWHHSYKERYRVVVQDNWIFFFVHIWMLVIMELISFHDRQYEHSHTIHKNNFLFDVNLE